MLFMRLSISIGTGSYSLVSFLRRASVLGIMHWTRLSMQAAELSIPTIEEEPIGKDKGRKEENRMVGHCLAPGHIRV